MTTPNANAVHLSATAANILRTLKARADEAEHAAQVAEAAFQTTLGAVLADAKVPAVEGTTVDVQAGIVYVPNPPAAPVTGSVNEEAAPVATEISEG